MRLTALCVCGTLLAFSSLSWITAHSDQGLLLGDKGFGPCTATLRPQGPCRQGEHGSTCPYLFSLPPLTVQLPQQLKQLENIVTDLQKLKDSVDELREMCADCTVSQTERECEKQREGEDEKTRMNERLQENNRDSRQHCGTQSGEKEKMDGDSNSRKGMNLEEKERKKWEAERGSDRGVIKENEKGDGKTQKERAKVKDNLGHTQMPTASGNEKTGNTGRERFVDKSIRETETARNPGKETQKGYKEDKKENEKDKKVNIDVRNKEKTEESDHRMGQDKTKKTEKRTEADSRIKMSEDHDEHTNEEQRQHGEEKEKEMEKGIKVEQNNEKPKRTDGIGHTEKEKTIKEGEVEVDGRETGKEIKTESVQSDGDGELTSSTAIETTDFVSIRPTPHSTINLSSRPDSTDSNNIFTSSLPSSPLPSSTVDLITDVSHKTRTSYGPTQSTGLGAAGISEHTSPSTTTATITTMGGPGPETASASTTSNSVSKVGPGAGVWGHVSSTTLAATTTTSYQNVYTTVFPGDQTQWTAKKNVSSTTKTSKKPLPGRGPKPGAKHKPGIKPEADKKFKNPKKDQKPGQVPVPDKKTKPDKNQKPSQQKPTTVKSKPGKQPKVPFSKPNLRPATNISPTDPNLKNEKEQLPAENKLPNQKPNSHQKTPVQRPTSHEKPKTVNATNSVNQSDEIPKPNKNPRPDKKVVQHPKTNKPEEKTEPDKKFDSNQDPVSKIVETTTFTSKPDQILQTESTEKSDEQSTPDPKSKVPRPGQKKSDQVDQLPDQRQEIPQQPSPDLNQYPKTVSEPETKTTASTSITSKPDGQLITESMKTSEETPTPGPNSKQISTPGQKTKPDQGVTLPDQIPKNVKKTNQKPKPDPVFDQHQHPKLGPESESTTASGFTSKPDINLPDQYITPDPKSNQESRPEQKDQNPKSSQKINPKPKPDQKLDLKQSPIQDPETESSKSKPDQNLLTESMKQSDPVPEPESKQDSTPEEKIKLNEANPPPDQKPKPNQKSNEKPKPDTEFNENQHPKSVPEPDSTGGNSLTSKPDQISQSESMKESEITTPGPYAKQIPTRGQKVKPGRADTRHEKRPKPGPKINQTPKPDQMSAPEPETKTTESTSFTLKPDQQPVTESMKKLDHNPTTEPKSNQVSPGQKIKSDLADLPSNQKPKPTPEISKINQKPRNPKPGQVPKPNQKPGKFVTNKKTKPKTNQGFKTPLPGQIPTPPPRYRPPTRPTVRPGATQVQRPKPAVQQKPNPKTTTYSDLPKTSWTTSDSIQNSQTSMAPTSGARKQIADVTHLPGGPELSPSMRKTITQGPKTSKRLETGPTPHLHTHTGDFTVSPNSRITSDLKPQTTSQPPLTPMATSLNQITRGILPSVIPSTSPGSTKPTPTPKSDSGLQDLHKEETTPTVPVSSARSQTSSTLSPDSRSTTSAISGLKPPAAESSTPSARELRVKINQVAAFLNNSLIPNGRPPERHPKEQPEDTRPGSKLTPSKVTRDCSDQLLRGQTRSGVYLVTPDLHRSSFPVFCDMEDDGGGWTLLQRRQDGTVSFNRTWAEYRSGFGKLDGGEFWLGNNLIHLLTRDRDMVLRVELEDFDGVTGHAQYDQFKVASERSRYRLTVDGYSGTAGDALRFNERYDHNNRAFTTPDRDHDRYPSGNCGAYYSSGWWFDACMAANLNGRYHVGRYKGVRDGIFWGTWHNISTEYYPTNERQSFKTVRMMIRPKGFTP